VASGFGNSRLEWGMAAVVPHRFFEGIKRQIDHQKSIRKFKTPLAPKSASLKTHHSNLITHPLFLISRLLTLPFVVGEDTQQRPTSCYTFAPGQKTTVRRKVRCSVFTFVIKIATFTIHPNVSDKHF
jgi:hypothetical protein